MEHSSSKLNFSTVSKPTVDLKKIGELNEYVCSLLGIFLNMLLCYLILFKTTSRLQIYKRVLLQNCFLDIFYNVINSVTHCQADFKEGNFFVLLNGPLRHLPMPWAAYSIALWVFALFFCVTGVPIQFLFRVYQHVNQSMHLPPEILDVHRQITTTLMVQAVAPIVICLLPIVLFVTGCFLYLNIPGAGIIINFMFAWIPLVNSLITIIAIKTYRHFCFGWMSKFKYRIHQSSTFFNYVAN
ncbi:hypothetical protein FO519_003140 [Halicephalobus sp. NKZ332]|nr:hypothetical protein FO519_003140 [Halicephalobus sp. NKZ332]